MALAEAAALRNSRLVRDMLLAFGLDRSLRIVRMHRRVRATALAALSVAFMGTNFPNWTPPWITDDANPRLSIKDFLWRLNHNAVNHLYRILIGLYFLSQLDEWPGLTWRDPPANYRRYF